MKTPFFKRNSVLLLSLFLVSACVSAPPPVVPPEVAAAKFLTDNKALLESGNDSLFFLHLNEASSNLREQVDQLLADYSEREQRLLSEDIKSSDYFQARFHLHNLSCVPDINKFDLAAAKVGVNKIAASQNMILAAPSDFDTGRQTFDSIKDFNNILAEVDVTRSYKNEDGLLRKERVFGSGFLIDETHLLTNYHVIAPAVWTTTESATIECSLNKGPKVEVSLLAWDSLNDIALLTLPEKTPLKFPLLSLVGNSSLLTQGDVIYTLGQHLGFTQTMTRGIVSAPQRKALEVGSWIQIDANLAPGASGGLAVGEDRRIYGVNVARIRGDSINFIIPIKTVLKNLDSLLKGISPLHPWLGVYMDKDSKGALEILDFFPTSPLPPLGIHKGDRIVSINGTKLDSLDQAQEALLELDAGNTIRLEVLQQNSDQSKTLYVPMPRRPDSPVYSAEVGPERVSTLYDYFGLEIEERSYGSLTFTIGGTSVNSVLFKVTRVRKNSFVEDMAIQKGDTIGFLGNWYEGNTRFIKFIHLPGTKQFRDLKDPADFVFTLYKEQYDENIL